MNNKRNVIFDIIRAICAVWIVAIWHIQEYGFPLVRTLPMGVDITMAVLGVFVFLSGYFLQKYSINGYKQIRFFYLKRIIRLYIPFLVVSVLMELIFHWYENGLQFILSLVGISFLYTPWVKTLWFVSILLFFYGITPIILSFTGKWKRLLCSAIIIAILVMVNSIIEIDPRTIYLCITYCIGLCISNITINRILENKYVFFASLLVINIYILLYNLNIDIGESNILRLPLVFSMLVILYKLSTIICKNKRLCNIFVNISYSSMMAYLLHRLIYVLFWHVCHEWPNSGWYFGLMIPIIFITSYYVQKIYDTYFVKRLQFCLL